MACVCLSHAREYKTTPKHIKNCVKKNVYRLRCLAKVHNVQKGGKFPTSSAQSSLSAVVLATTVRFVFDSSIAFLLIAVVVSINRPLRSNAQIVMRCAPRRLSKNVARCSSRKMNTIVIIKFCASRRLSTNFARCSSRRICTRVIIRCCASRRFFLSLILYAFTLSSFRTCSFSCSNCGTLICCFSPSAIKVLHSILQNGFINLTLSM